MIHQKLSIISQPIHLLQILLVHHPMNLIKGSLIKNSEKKILFVAEGSDQ